MLSHGACCTDVDTANWPYHLRLGCRTLFFWASGTRAWVHTASWPLEGHFVPRSILIDDGLEAARCWRLVFDGYLVMAADTLTLILLVGPVSVAPSLVPPMAAPRTCGHVVLS